MKNSTPAIIVFSLFAVGAIPLVAQPPSIAAVENNYSFTVPSVPNYGIAPGSLFVIYGSNLSTVTVPVLQSSAAPGVPLALSGVTVSVAVNGINATVPLYYISATQIAGIMPSTVPAGSGTITVTSNGQASSPAPLRVVASNFGILTTNNSGYGSAAAYDANNKLLTASSSASPGQTIVLWGSGVGADPANDDRVYPQKQNNLTNIPMQVFIGGISAPILYRGRSQYPGVDQIDVVVPPGGASGCYVSVIVMSGNYVSNSTTLPIAANGGTCSDPNTEYTPAQLKALAGKSTVKIAAVSLDLETALPANVVRNVLRGKFLSYTMAEFAATTPSDGFISYGSCQIRETGKVPTHVNAGSSLTVTGPGGAQGSAPLNTLKNGNLGDYRVALPAGFIPNGGGMFTFSNGAGSAAVGPLSRGSITMPAPILWTNSSAISTIDRSQGVAVTWSGGSAGTFVVIQGSAMGPAPANQSVSFACAAPVNSGQFMVPPSVLLALPTGTGQLFVYNVTFPQPVSATGLDLGSVFAEIGSKESVTYR